MQLKLKINSRHFIGPSSTTLQLENIINNEDTNIPNILDKRKAISKLIPDFTYNRAEKGFLAHSH